eukprot:752949-Prymnesium_polylepis.1
MTACIHLEKVPRIFAPVLADAQLAPRPVVALLAVAVALKGRIDPTKAGRPVAIPLAVVRPLGLRRHPPVAQRQVEA